MEQNSDLLPELTPDSIKKTIDFSPNIKTISSIEELINVISAYFDIVNQNITKPTFTGLALSLGITRQQLLDFPENNPYYPVVLKAKQYIVDYVEQQLYEPKSSAGTAFWLKNNDGWVDKQEVSVTHHKTMKDIISEIDKKNSSPIAFDAEIV